MDELSVKIGVKERLIWQRDQERSRGCPRMRWEDCVKRDLETVEGEWRTTTKDRLSWRLLIENVAREK